MKPSRITPESLRGVPLALVCHDAGGAEQIARLALTFNWNFKAATSGPAHLIFERVIGEYKSVALNEALVNAEVVISGSGWSSTSEFDAISQARVRKIPVITVLDHWVNYRERFTRNGILKIPDAFWVTDEYAMSIANLTFPGSPVQLIPNLLLEEVAASVAAVSEPEHSEGPRLLIVCEPIADHYPKKGPHSLGYDEWSALHYLLTNLTAISPKFTAITIRPHPSESPNKYDQVALKFPELPIFTEKHPTLVESIAASEVVAGCESMAMTLAVAANRRVITIIPPAGLKCRLPHAAIESLADLIELRNPAPTIHG